tara:strand:+ start:3034 stop:3441 length:408 start_codon:yes stop_codon:yes gene_type:complete
MLADVIPIAVFIIAYTWFAFKRYLNSSHWLSSTAVLFVILSAIIAPMIADMEGASYLAALFALLIVGSYLKFSLNHPAGFSLLFAGIIFAFSLFLRTIDGPICSIYPFGSHFGWHILNAFVLFIVSRSLILYGKK